MIWHRHMEYAYSSKLIKLLLHTYAKTVIIYKAYRV